MKLATYNRYIPSSSNKKIKIIADYLDDEDYKNKIKEIANIKECKRQIKVYTDKKKHNTLNESTGINLHRKLKISKRIEKF